MHFGVIGLGPVGAVFAASLKKADQKVSVLCRNVVRANYFQKNPLNIEGEYKAKVQLDNVYSSSVDFVNAKPDIIFICTKGVSSEDLCKELKAMGLGKGVIFVSAQNGIEVEEQVVNTFSIEHSLRMVINFGGNFISSDTVHLTFNFKHFLSCNPHTNGIDQKIADVLNQSGLNVEVVENYKEEAFKKAVLNTSLGSVCALTRMTMADVMKEPELFRLVKEVIRESVVIGQGLKFNIGPEFVDVALGYLSKGGAHKPSMLVDIENGRITENEYHAGKLFRCAEKVHVESPVIQTIYYLIKNLEYTLVMKTYES